MENRSLCSTIQVDLSWCGGLLFFFCEIVRYFDPRPTFQRIPAVATQFMMFTLNNYSTKAIFIMFHLMDTNYAYRVMAK